MSLGNNVVHEWHDMVRRRIPVYPGMQLQLNDPGVFTQVAP